MPDRQTIFSPCRRYRYTLWREFETSFLFDGGNKMKDGYVMFIGLNPSTADETKDDPTIRRCIGYAKSWGYGALCMTNLFAWRETDSSKLRLVENPVGADNQHYLLKIASEAALVIAAWGTKGTQRGIVQDLTVCQWLKEVGVEIYCLRKTKDGHPEHPLYLPKNLNPQRFEKGNHETRRH